MQNDHNLQVIEKAEREREKGLEKEAEIKRLKEQHAQLIERKQELQHQVQRHTLYGDFMKRAVRMTKVLQGFLHDRAVCHKKI